MTRYALVFGLVMGLTGPGFAASTAKVAYTLTFNKPVQVVGMDGVIQILRVTGTIGGVAVIGEYEGSDWRVGPKVSPAATFASGTLSCSASKCNFSITTLLDRPADIKGPSFAIGDPVSSPLAGYANRGAWVAAVTYWADNNVSAGLRERIVSQAAGDETGYVY